jgi:hypothetical protein
MSIDTSGGHPAMDYREHVGTYRGFVRAAQYGTVAVIVLLALMAYFLV